MIAQYYDDEYYVRIFINAIDVLMDCYLPGFDEDDLKDASKALSRCNLKRKTKWKKEEWGFECRVCWKREK